MSKAKVENELVKLIAKAIRTGKPARMTKKQSERFHKEFRIKSEGQLEKIRRINRAATAATCRNTILD